ncbi:helix-turn-helix domain-containing protein [Roseomonas gilardii]|uniref:Helix-turn-helix domain-containing protein n=1 Tax=Roseomonas gilardii TaxID=257708 RepID=A0ABU3MBE1_9PROT|nr:helix-turn-helix domain-containing protein [Roseomonas gilardii]MDT8330216.1 helix-turn-helix domain-containing protein [Roseomonas gilardii]
MFRTIHRYEEDGLGLPYPVVLYNAAQEEVDDETGKVIGISIPNMEGLVAAVAILRAMIPVQLDGAEVRFIRQVIGKSSKQFAEELNLDPATLSRWENNKQTVGEWADGQVRHAAVLLLSERAPSMKVDIKDVWAMHPRKRQAGELWPEIEVVLEHVEDPCPEQPVTPEPDTSWQPMQRAA